MEGTRLPAVNPYQDEKGRKAGKGNAEKIIPNIEKECKKRNYEYEIRFIEKELSGADIAREYKDEENVTREDILKAGNIIKARTNRRLMNNGVSFALLTAQNIRN